MSPPLSVETTTANLAVSLCHINYLHYILLHSVDERNTQMFVTLHTFLDWATCRQFCRQFSYDIAITPPLGVAL